MNTMLDNLMESREFSGFLFQNLSSAIFILDKDLRVRRVNDTYRALFQKEEADVLDQLCGNSIGCAFAVEEGKPCGTTTECGTCSLRKCLVDGSVPEGMPVQSASITRDFYIGGRPVRKHFRVRTRNIAYAGENMSIVSIDDVTELEEQKERIREMADHDYLTGLYNRRSLFEYGGKLYENALRGSFYLAVAMIDIDFFKKINDSYGHDAGDSVLSAAAGLLRGHMREADIVSRFGGEEFCLIFSVRQVANVFPVMEKLRRAVEENAFLFNGERIPVTVSIGVTFSLEDSLGAMISSADRMLYRAKEEGRNRVVVFRA